MRARQPLQSISWSPNKTCSTIQGRKRTAGIVGGNNDTIGVPTAAATCAAPVFPTTIARASPITRQLGQSGFAGNVQRVISGDEIAQIEFAGASGYDDAITRNVQGFNELAV
jgi:hypothetical protein